MSRQDTNKIRKTIEYITNTTIGKGQIPKSWSGTVISYNGLTKEAEVRIAGDPADNTNTFLNISGHVLRADDLVYLTSYDGDLTNAYISNSREADDTYGNYVEFRYQRASTQPTTPTGEDPAGWYTDPPSGTDLLWMSKILRTPLGYIVEGETWSTPVRIQGENGNYVEFRYKRASTQPSTPTGDDPVGWTTEIPSGSETLWMSQVLKDTDGSIVGTATWSTPVQFEGEDGSDGAVGAGVVYRGDFVAGETYYYTSYRRDIVSYGGTYYIYNVSSDTTGNVVSSWNISEWEEFSDTFKSVATALLLAEDATILHTLVMGYDVGEGSGLIRSASKNAYGSADAGFWLGYDGATPKFDIGNGTDYLRWDGSALSIRTDDLQLFGANGSLFWDGSALKITGYLGDDGASRIELNDGNISTYVSDVLRMKLDYNSLDFYRAGFKVGFMESRYVSESFAGAVLGDCLYIEADGNAIAFNANNTETSVALIVYPTWTWVSDLQTESSVMFGANGVHTIGLSGTTSTASWFFQAPNSSGLPVKFMEYYPTSTEVVVRENWDFSSATVTGLTAVAVFG